jgi:hypothetical protein
VLALPLPVLEGIGPSTLNIGQIHGGHAPNVVADKAEAQVLVRTVTDSAPVRAQLVEAAGDLAEVEFTLDTPFVRLRAVEGLPTMVAKFSTDIPQLSNWGEPLLLGPGSIHVAHTPFEKLAKKELLEAVELYIQGGSPPMARIADSGWLMIGVPNSSPKTPELVSVKVDPETSAGLSFLPRALSARSAIARARSAKLRSSASLITGTIRPHSSATAMPRSMWAW